MEHRQQIIRAMAGDRAAREQLFDETIQTVYYLCWKLTGSAAQAGEATRRACARAFSTLGDLRPEVSFERWITAIAVALCRQTLSKTRPRLFSTDAQELAVLEHADVTDEACLPPDCVADPILRGDALRAVRALPSVQRMTMVLRYAALMKPHQIAKYMDVDEYTVFGRLNCGRLALKQALPCDSPAAMLTALFAAEAEALNMPEPLRESCLQTALNAAEPAGTELAPQEAPEPPQVPSGGPGSLFKRFRFGLYGGIAGAALLLVLIVSLAIGHKPAAGTDAPRTAEQTEQAGSAAKTELTRAEQIRDIRDRYYAFQESISEYEQVAAPERHICYTRSGQIDCIRYDSELTEDGRYSVSFYYKDAEPYFIYLLGADGDDRELRLYYWNGTLIRWIERDTVVHETPNEQYQSMYDWAEEQYEQAMCAET